MSIMNITLVKRYIVTVCAFLVYGKMLSVVRFVHFWKFGHSENNKLGCMWQEVGEA